MHTHTHRIRNETAYRNKGEIVGERKKRVREYASCSALYTPVTISLSLCNSVSCAMEYANNKKTYETI